MKELFNGLQELINIYGGKEYKIQQRIIKDIIGCIDSDLTIVEKEVYIIRSYKSLYPKEGGLSDFFIYHDNYEERLKLNKPLDEIRNCIWKIMKEYI